jgi:hypothetical protein
MKLPRLHSRDDEDTTSSTAVPVGIQTLAYLVDRPLSQFRPTVLESVSLSLGDDIVVDGADETITITGLPDSESATDTDSRQ